jgi:hypothetical protein
MRYVFPYPGQNGGFFSLLVLRFHIVGSWNGGYGTIYSAIKPEAEHLYTTMHDAKTMFYQ